MAGQRVRILLTDGARVADFAWLRYSLKQVACGVPEGRDSWHVTYPANGKVRYSLRRALRQHHVPWPVKPIPLGTFSGQRELLQLRSPLELGNDLTIFRWQPQDVIAFLDLRAFPKDRMICTSLGLIEAGKADQLQFDFSVHQVLLVTRVTPWIYIASGVVLQE